MSDPEVLYRFRLVALEAEMWSEREKAMIAIEKSGKLSNPESQYDVGVIGLNCSYPDVQTWAIGLLVKSGRKEAVDLIKRVLEHTPFDDVKEVSLKALAQLS